MTLSLTAGAGHVEVIGTSHCQAMVTCLQDPIPMFAMFYCRRILLLTEIDFKMTYNPSDRSVLAALAAPVVTGGDVAKFILMTHIP